jgi:NAD(P)-dependent dehydrogenase (short-subunit alcohol dehydrogenase family)
MADAQHTDSIPLKRLANPQDVACLVAFLTSGKAAYLNGGAFVVDGGATGCLS